MSLNLTMVYWSRSYRKQPDCIDSVACSKFLTNGFLLISAQEKILWFSVHHATRQGKRSMTIASVKKEKTSTICTDVAKEWCVDEKTFQSSCRMSNLLSGLCAFGWSKVKKRQTRAEKKLQLPYFAHYC